VWHRGVLWNELGVYGVPNGIIQEGRIAATILRNWSAHGQLFLTAIIAVVNAAAAHQSENVATATVRLGRLRCRQTSAAATAIDASAMHSSTRSAADSCGE
jgi:hypothetical protein